MIALLALVVQAHASELAANHQVDSLSSSDELVKQLLDSQESSDEFVNKLLEKLSDRLLNVLPVQDTDLDDTAMGKPGNLATASRPIPSGPVVQRFSPTFAVAPGSSGPDELPLVDSPRALLGRRGLTAAVVGMMSAATALEALADADQQKKGFVPPVGGKKKIAFPGGDGSQRGYLFGQPVKQKADGPRGRK